MDDLTRYVKDRIGQPFEWGALDCVTFANEALRAYTGEAPFWRWMNGYRWADAREAVRCFGAWRKDNPGDLVDILDSMFEREFVLYPRHGYLVCREVPGGVPFGFALGVVVEGRCAFVSSDAGVTIVDPVTSDMYWSVK